MSVYVRVFSLVEDYPSLNAICDCLSEEDFEFATSPGKGEPEFLSSNWKSIVFQYDEEGNQIELERDTKESGDHIFDDEKHEFIEAVGQLTYSKGLKQAKHIVKEAKQIYAFEINPDMDEKGWEFLECILDFLCDATDGYVQIDEEGIYDKEGQLLVEMD